MRSIRKGLRSRAQSRPRIPRKITRTGVGAALVAALTALGALAAMTASAAPAAPAGHGGGHLSISKQFFGKTIEPYTNVNTPTYRYTLTNANGVSIALLSDGDAGGAAGSPGCPNGCTVAPAQISVDVTFTLNNAGQYGIHYKVHNDSKTLSTVQNLTNHSYFNLAGESSPAGSEYSQYVQMNANNYSPTDSTQIPLPLPNGVPVAGTPFDFRAPHTIGSRIDQVSAPDNTPASFASATGGKSQLLIAQRDDPNWILNAQTPRTTGPDGLNLAARAFDPGSGRALTVWTDQPGVQFYSGNFLNGTLVGISGNTYRQCSGYTFQAQHVPSSPNQPSFRTTPLASNATFPSHTFLPFSSSPYPYLSLT